MVQILILITLSFFTNAQAPNSPAKKPLLTGQSMTITYGSVSWNADSKSADSAYLVIRDKNTEKLVLVTLEETEPDSSQFKGRFSLSFSDGGQVAPEVYVPPLELRQEKDVKKVYDMIQNGELVRKPVILRRNEKVPVLDVYDTREQAERALKVYQQQLALKSKPDEVVLENQKLANPGPSPQDLEAAKLAQLKALAAEASRREAERVRLEQMERQKREALEAQAKRLSEKERAERLAKARALGQEGVKSYQASDFVKAESLFKQATELDPESREFTYKYGVSLYRNNKFNEALVLMKITPDDPAINLEKQYYLSLIHLRLKEYTQALEPLEKVIASKDKILGPSALFYKGVVLFEMEKFEEAKKPFEDVIDNSTDPALDQAAEDYIDRIAVAINNKIMREKNWTVSANVGLMYDSNVTLSQTTDPLNSFATKELDFKVMGSANLERRMIFTDHHEFALASSFSGLQATKPKLQYTDPWLMNVTAPYSYKGVIGQKGYKLGLTPGYEILNMGEAPGDTTKKDILDSYFLGIDNTLIMRKDYFASYSLEIRHDSSQLASSDGPNNIEALKYSLKTAQSFFLDSARKEIFIATLGYVLNAAKGDEKKYTRVELGGTYVRPVWEDSTWNMGLSWYRMAYPKSTADRLDQNLTIASGVSRAWREWCTLSLNGSYTVNNSNMVSSQYDKFLLMSLASFKTNF